MYIYIYIYIYIHTYIHTYREREIAGVAKKYCRGGRLVKACRIAGSSRKPGGQGRITIIIIIIILLLMIIIIIIIIIIIMILTII